jgi:hypothetical protein
MTESQVGRRAGERAAGEVLEGEGMVLEGGVQVGLALVPRVARLSEQGEVREAKIPDQLGGRRQARL